MRNFVLLSLVTLSVFWGSCNKNTPPPIDYLVDTVSNAYLNQDDSLHLPLQIRFLTGNASEEVYTTIEGLPSFVKLAKDTLRGVPTFTADFILYTTYAAAPLGNYPVTLVVHSPSIGTRKYGFNLGIVHYHCSSYLLGVFSCVNACNTNYTYTTTQTALGDTGLNVVNFGGYGLNTTTFIKLNCNTDSVTISRQNIGNGVTVTGSGHFEANKLIIRYTAENIPTGGNDNCSVVMTKL